MNVISNTIKGLHPAYFALVMSTGIISVASKLLGFTGIACALFYINIISYAILLPILVLRVIVIRNGRLQYHVVILAATPLRFPVLLRRPVAFLHNPPALL